MSIQNNTEALQQILQAVNDLPEEIKLPSLSNPGTADDLASGKQLIDSNGNVVTGTHECVTGATVQVKTGSVTVSGSGGTADCGFKPDAVFFTGSSSYDSAKVHAGVAFHEANVTSMGTMFGGPDNEYLFSQFTVTQTSTGFTVKGVKVSWSYDEANESNRSVSYIAIKYTE